MTNYASGHLAEKKAADYLKNQGFKIRELNWKTRYCEIDIVAQKKKTLYFVEVKSRGNASQGEGLDYITSAKLHKMTFASEMWVKDHGWDGPYQLSALSLTADEVTFIESIEL